MASLTPKQWCLVAIGFIAVALITRVWIDILNPLTPDQFERYRGALWFTVITSTGHIQPNSFQPIGLLQDANQIIFNLQSTITLVELHQLTGLDFSFLQKLPIPEFLIIIFQALIIRQLFDDKRAIIVGIILAVSLQYYLFEVTLSFNRVSEGILGIYLLLYAVSSKKSRKSYVLVFVSSMFLILSYSSLAVIWIIFMIVYGLVSRNASRSIAILYSIACVLYYLLLTVFLVLPLSDLGRTIQGHELSLSFLLQLSVPTDLRPPPDSLGIVLTRFAWAAAAFLVGFAVVARVRRFITTKKPETIDAMIIATLVMIVSGIAFQSLTKSVSGGTDPFFLFYIMAPIVASYTMLHFPVKHPVTSKVLRFLVVIFVCIALVSSILIAPDFHNHGVGEVTVGDVVVSGWIGNYHTDLPVESSFSLLSTLLAVGGPIATAIPYSNNFSAYRATFFPTNNTSIRGNSLYVTTLAMSSTGIYTTSGLQLKPNPELPLYLERNYPKIYSSPEDSVYFI